MLVAMGLWGGKSTSLNQLITFPAGLQAVIYRLPFNLNQPDEVSYAGGHGFFREAKAPA